MLGCDDVLGGQVGEVVPLPPSLLEPKLTTHLDIMNVSIGECRQ
jgi:hypothetical protein